RVAPLRQALLAEHVADAGVLGCGRDVGGQVGGDDGDAGGRTQDDVAGQHRDPADADGDVDPGERHPADRRGVDVAVEDVDPAAELLQALQVADPAVDHGAHAGAGGDGRAQVVADHGALDDLAEDVDDH